MGSNLHFYFYIYIVINSFIRGYKGGNIFIITINVNGLNLLATGFLIEIIHSQITRDTLKHKDTERSKAKG